MMGDWREQDRQTERLIDQRNKGRREGLRLGVLSGILIGVWVTIAYAELVIIPDRLVEECPKTVVTPQKGSL